MKFFFCLLSFLPLLGHAHLRVLSYNIKHGEGMDGKVDLPRIINVLRTQTPDLIALQEVDQATKRSSGILQADQIAKSLGNPWQAAFAKFMNYDGGAYGLAILSRYPVIDQKVHKLASGMEPRVALELIIDIPSETSKQRLSVVCVHFDYIRDDSIRYQQATQLIAKLSDRKHPVIITGDFNDVRSSRTLKAFAASYTLPPSAGLTFDASNPKTEIDFCVYRGLKTPLLSVIEEKQASDHRPLLSVFPGF